MDISVVVALIMVGIPGFISLILHISKRGAEKKLIEAEIAERITTAAATLSDKLHAEIARLESKVENMEKQILRLQNGVNKLIAQIRAKGEVPCWTPDEDDL